MIPFIYILFYYSFFSCLMMQNSVIVWVCYPIGQNSSDIMEILFPVLWVLFAKRVSSALPIKHQPIMQLRIDLCCFHLSLLVSFPKFKSGWLLQNSGLHTTGQYSSISIFLEGIFNP